MNRYFVVTHCLLAILLPQIALAEEQLDFARDIRPILSNHCFACHGPDEQHREAELRLDTREGALGARDAGAAFVAGKLDESEAWRRMTSDDPDQKMPPVEGGKPLAPHQIDLLRRWIEQGAVWSEHWSFVAPARPAVPTIENPPSHIANPIDAFILARLEREHLLPSPEADRVTLLRRLSLDLIGLPPTPEEIAAFLNDTRPEAYGEQIERLLRSPHHGEKWARHWLDAARYADSDGYEKDKPRQVWFYRDWVINSLNADLPYDQFLIEQIAGDLLPQATQDQMVATGFLRNSMINEEGGVDPEQFRMDAMFDRMDAVGKAMLGLSVQCAQCHNHKYDPLTQAEYYGLFAFLNNSHEGSITVYTADQQRERERLFAEMRAIEEQLQAATPDWPARLAAWEQQTKQAGPVWTIVRPELDASGGQKHYLLEDGSILAAGYAPTKHTTEFTVEVPQRKITALRLELLNDPNLPHNGPGRSIHGLCALSEFQATATPLGSGNAQSLKFTQATADVNPPQRDLDPAFDDRTDKKRVTGPVAMAIDGDALTAWSIETSPGRGNVPHNAVFVLQQPLESEGGFRITFKLQQNHGGWNSDDNQNNNLGRFRFAVTSAEQAVADPIPAAVRHILTVPAQQRSESQRRELFSYWRTTVPEWQAENEQVEQLWQQHPRGTSQLVLQERETSRPTHRLDRGSFLKPLETIAAHVPAFLHPLQPATGNPTRLDFARWLADRRSPMTARAHVNRIWQAYFGSGLVETSEDLGSQGALPSHPELLDWLAVEFMEHGWSQKHLHRLIVTSATYRQSSKVTPELLAHDPFNRWLARGPRLRVDAESVRDIALAASGLLDRTVGGPSVYPPAPEFLFQPPASYGPKVWKQDAGAEKYRRALYTFRFRSVPYPALQAFDAPTGDFSCTRRSRSNTPLQALTTLNEPLFVECAAALAARTLREGGEQDVGRLNYAFQCCAARTPTSEEAAILLDLLQRQRSRTGDSATDMVPWTVVARVLLNLDETITKE